MNKIAVPAAAVLVLGGAIAWLRLGGVPAHPRLLHPEVPAPAWQAYLSELPPPPPAPDELDARLGLLAARTNRAEIAAALAGRSVENDAAFARAATELQRAAKAYLDERGPDRFALLGRRRGLAFAAATGKLLARCRRETIGLQVALASADPTARAYIDLGGAFVLFAEANGFVQGGRLVKSRRPLLQALFVHQWVRPLAQVRDPELFLRPDEFEWLMRWRIEWLRGGRLQTRIEAADRLRALKSYPADYNAAVLLLRAGRREEAADRLRHTGTARAAALLRAIQT